ncbi:hypothetical protein VC83_01383 [Pseudogymnoascus destructans]|uniref:SRP9 domain-containing protein n=2 Tax=Pseudogymnoascus destructans TaxID=655981 RepID=L8G342_PSED2|nr:uncharacterized protein VC83_09555 [Pseudogymnoascus destructans]XP_024327008.1 uncharacterized protein VC83_01380 [Pseudogymnoascus destructans]XP_024327009.1 uncharacterized protein VC83_01383 [Pseudogymnoascus destructans]ELR07244.1 hypothetical protein GMDG_02471 [Pseudogymnoascus destructans 20631-21]OAF54173.1 hypothetical protein VC83_09555 [Pseudogymnoascus destructans]OAF61734.1 hypothetical protein VC83_01380 [Pseudogymnoascus destructans]OAF61735.1 hypothetical protein VC83_0138
MPYLPTAQEWLTQSALLLQARPTTSRITTKYTVKPSTRRTTAETAAPAPVAFLTLKTYDPASGTTLKYRTDKAAEVGRLVLSLSRLGREMAGLPELKEEDIKMEGAGDAVAAAAAPVPEKAGAQPGGAKKGKKKGRK